MRVSFQWMKLLRVKSQGNIFTRNYASKISDGRHASEYTQQLQDNVQVNKITVWQSD